MYIHMVHIFPAPSTNWNNNVRTPHNTLSVLQLRTYPLLKNMVRTFISSSYLLAHSSFPVVGESN